MSYTINPNAKNKWARNAENTMDLSLETDASSVYLDNGRTLEQEIGEGSMVSNVTTVDSAMSKVIDGTLDGAYESLVFKGKSLVNLVEKPTSANVGNSGKWNGYGGGSPSKTFITNGIRLANTQHGSIVLDYFDLSLFKPNTKYTLFIDVYHNGKGNPPVLDKIAGTGQYAIPLKNGHNCIVFTSVSDLTVANMGIRFGYAGSTSESCVYEFSNIVIIEGDHSSINPDYFEGICDVKMPILRNVGKNLFDKNTMKTSWWINQDGVKKDSGNTNYSILVPATQNKVYSVSFDVSNRSFYAFLDKDYNTLLSQTGYVTKTAPQGTKYLLYYLHNENIDLCGDIQLEEATAKTTYEDYKTNILRTSEEIVLRSLPNGVKDILNLNTGEYVQHIGEIVFNGSEYWEYVNQTFRTDIVKDKVATQNNTTQIYVICDKYKSIPYSEPWNIGEFISLHTNKQVVIRDEGFANTQDWKQYLSQNPLTVQYELAEPITTIVEPLTIPFAYQNGHIILESGSEEQSLLPTLEYSTVINKTGLIENVAKTIQRQEKQLTKLEQMLIQNIINLDYNNTLLTLKNEMEEML